MKLANHWIWAVLLTVSLDSLCFAAPKTWDEFSVEEREQALITSSYELGHQRFRRDCSGFIEAILKETGHDLSGFLQTYDIRANGVRQIYEYLRRSGNISQEKLPRPGDLVFFSRTYDLNRDRKFNDELTHIGLVVSVDKDGTIEFRHVLQGKIRTDYMNLFKPTVYEENGKTLNSYLRRPVRGSAGSMLTSQLFDFFGTLNP